MSTLLKTCLHVYCFLLCGWCTGQKNTYLGLETAITNDRLLITDPGKEILPAPLIGGRIGLSFCHDLTKFTRLEYALTFKNYQEGYRFNQFSSYATSSAFSAICVPVRLHFKIPVYKKSIYLCPLLGLSYAKIPAAFSGGSNHIKLSSITDSITFMSTSIYNMHPNYFLVQAGFSIDWLFNNNSMLSLYTAYYAGSTTIAKTEFTYQKNNQSPMSGQARSTGTFWDIIGIAYKYPLSKLKEKS